MAKQTQPAAKAAETTETTAPVTLAAPATPAVKEPTSEKLTELYALRSKLSADAKAEPDEKKSDEIMMNWWKAGEDIKSEIALIKKNEIELLKKEKEAGLIQLVQNLLEADRAAQASIGNEGLSLDEKQVISDKYKTAYEIVTNKVLGSSKVHPTTNAASNGNGNGKGATTKEIVELITPLYAEGKTGKEVRAFIKEYGGGGAWTYFNDGTANGAIKAYERANGISE